MRRHSLQHAAMRWLAMLLPALLGACSMFGSSAEPIPAEALLEQIGAGNPPLIVDVRTDGEFSQGHIPGAIHIDHREIDDHLAQLVDYRDKPIVVYCLSGMRAGMVEQTLIDAGFSRIQHLVGDWSKWQAAGLPIVIPQKDSAH